MSRVEIAGRVDTAAGWKQLRVLLIEDDPSYARYIREILGEMPGAPFRMQHAHRLSEGIAILKEGAVDVVLLDLMLPDSMRLDTVRAVVEQFPQVPIVVLTTLHDEQTGLEAVQAGAQDYLFKGEAESPLLSRAMRYAVERKQVEQALKQVNRNLSLMNSITRHDILNQLTIILGYLPVAQDLATDPEQREYLNRIAKAAAAIHRQIEFSREYQNIGVQSPQWQRIRPSVYSALNDLDIGDTALSIDLPEIEVFADPMLEKVFYNLIDNSLRHGGRVTAIRMHARESEDGMRIVYEDDGIGVPAGEKEKIFRRSKGGDHGFGLFLIRNILAITNIQIRECGEPGEGARFEMHIPPGSYRPAGRR
ncbi:MAG: hybrid sensor histidine kinase/response regulator [Methanomicrobiales archaeon]|nr:hybrid sensor histidine kinase/response regulator [Methanomicrobiales archaeon]MDI6875379.1 hybrid sensor histidine kinase/response regulator [Methanomicrobiales archaeon]